MASEMMQSVLAAEKACDEKLAAARAAAAATVQDAVARADGMRRDAAGFGKKKAAEILAAAEAEADRITAAQKQQSAEAVGALRARAAEKREAAVAHTVDRLLELS